MTWDSISIFVWLGLASLLLINVLLTFFVAIQKPRIGLYKGLLVAGIWIVPLLGSLIALVSLSGKKPLDPTNTAYESRIPGDI